MTEERPGNSEEGWPKRKLVVCVGVIALLAFAVRLLYSHRRTVVYDWDGASYLMIAQNLAGGYGLRNIPHGAPHTWCQPLYPMMVAGLAKLGMKVEPAAYLVSSVFGSLGVIPLFVLGRQMYSTRVGFIAALLMLSSYRMIEASAGIITEMPYIFFWLWAVVATLKLVEQPSRPILVHVAIGAALGVAGLIRTEAVIYFFLYVTVTLCTVAFRATRNKAGGRQTLLGVSAAAAVFLIILAPYISFLHRALGYFTFTGRTRETVFAVMDAHSETYEFFPGSPVRYVLNHPVSAIGRIVHNLDIISSRHVTWALHPISMMLIACSLFVQGWDRRRLVREAIFSLILVFPWFTFYGITGILTRYYLPSVALVFVWVANGIENLHVWLSRTWASLGFARRAPSARSVALLGVGVVVFCSARQLAVPIVKGKFSEQAQARKDRLLGTRIASITMPGHRPNILCVSPRVAYYATGNFFGDLVPKAITMADLRPTLNSKHIDYLVVDNFFADQNFPKLASLREPALAPDYLQFVERVQHEADDGSPASTIIYRYANRL